MTSRRETVHDDDAIRIDRALMSGIARGEADALERFYDRHAAVALTVIIRIVGDRRTAEDILQEAFLQVWRKADSFDAARGNPRGWALAIAHNLGLNELRRRRSRPVIQDAPPPESASADPMLTAPDPGPSPADLAWQAEERRRIERALRELPDTQQQVLRMYAAGYSQSEIAGELDKPLGSVKTWMRRGLHQMRTHFDAETPDTAESSSR